MNRDQIKSAMAMGGATARHTLLAHAFQRGVPYRVLELDTRADNPPNPIEVFRLATGQENVRSKDEAWAILAWMAQPAPSAVLEHNKRVRDEYMAAKAERRKQYEALRRG